MLNQVNGYYLSWGLDELLVMKLVLLLVSTNGGDIGLVLWLLVL